MAELTKATTCFEASPEGRVVGSNPAASANPEGKLAVRKTLDVLDGDSMENPHRQEHRADNINPKKKKMQL